MATGWLGIGCPDFATWEGSGCPKPDLYRRASNGLSDNAPSTSAKPGRPELREQLPDRSIVIIAFPGVTLLDFSGPAQVFAELQEIELPAAGYALSYVSTSGGLVPTD